MRRIIALFIVLFFCVCTLSAQQILRNTAADSVRVYIKLAEDGSLDLDERHRYVLRAIEISKNLKQDVLLLKSQRTLSSVYLFQEDYERYQNVNHNNLKLAKRLKDTLAIAVSNHNLGWYHHLRRVQNDSAYFYYSTAIQLYEHLKESSRAVGALQNIADIQEMEKAYRGAEENAIKALELLEDLPQSQSNLDISWNLYNLLGVITLKLKLYDKSIEYHEHASKIARVMDDGFLLNLYSKNNIAFIYKERGAYKKALDRYQEVFTEYEFFDVDPTFYALVLDNVTYTRFLLGDYQKDELLKDFQRAYKIADSLEDPITKLAISIDRAKVFGRLKIADSAYFYAQESYDLARQTSSNDILLESILLLSDLTEGPESKSYLQSYINFNDSLVANERLMQNKFGRIKFETDQMALENQRFYRERYWLILLSSILILVLILLFIVIRQRSKNIALQSEKNQQEANEAIYNLLLSQHDQIEEVRSAEKNRISQELHDGVLADLFGVRLSLDGLNKSSTATAIEMRASYIAKLKTIGDEIRKVSHELNADFVIGSGFKTLLSDLVATQAQVFLLQYTFECNTNVDWELVSTKTKINIYRIIQEGLQNVYKHANATKVSIGITLQNDVICMTISDDGIGFDLLNVRKGIGVKNIQSRVEELDGTVSFENNSPQGTSIHIFLPYLNS